LKKRKTLKSETYERWELKKTPKGQTKKVLERVAKPCGGDFGKVGQSFSDAIPKGRRTKGSSDPDMLMGRGSSSKVLF